MLAGTGRSRGQKLFIIIPNGRGATLHVSAHLSIALSGSEQFKQVKFQSARVELSKYLIHVIKLSVALLIKDNSVHELHICAPSRYGFKSLLCIANFLKVFQALVSLGFGCLFDIWHEAILREGHAATGIV